MRFITRAVFLFIALLAASTAAAQPSAPPPDFAGRWALQLDDRIFGILELRRAGSGYAGTWQRPAEADYAQNLVFSGVGGAIVRRNVLAATVGPTGLALTIEGRNPAPDHYVLRLIDADHGELAIAADIAPPPLPLIRAPADAEVAAQWDRQHAYFITTPRPSNAELTALLGAGQGRPTAGGVTFRNGGASAQARTRVREMVAAGLVNSGTDYFNAATIMALGEEADDQLLAHVLATAALARGRPDAGNLAASTLDKYLLNSGRSQIFGTSLHGVNTPTPTLEPYRRDFVADPVRAALGLLGQAMQEEAMRRVLGRLPSEIRNMRPPAPTPRSPTAARGDRGAALAARSR